jgi:hypothetical protein
VPYQVVELGKPTRTTQSRNLRSRPGGLRSAHTPQPDLRRPELVNGIGQEADHHFAAFLPVSFHHFCQSG